MSVSVYKPSYPVHHPPMSLAEQHPLSTDPRFAQDANGRLLVDWGAGLTSRGEHPRQSVSRLVYAQFPPFDEKARLHRYRQTPKGRADRRPNDEVRRVWGIVDEKQRHLGTRLHALAEKRANKAWTQPGAEPPTRAEHELFREVAWTKLMRWFAQEKPVFYRTELPLLDVEANVTGIADLLAVDGVEGDALLLALYDYKFGKLWDTPFTPGDTGACGLPNCNRYTYALALSIYRLLIERIPGPWIYDGKEYARVRVTRNVLVVTSPRYSSTFSVEVDHYDGIARRLLWPGQDG